MFNRLKVKTVFISLMFFIFSCEDNNSENVEIVSSIVVSPVNPLTEPNKTTQFYALVISSRNKELVDQPIVFGYYGRNCRKHFKLSEDRPFNA